MKKKTFDAVKMVRKIRNLQAEEFWKNPESYAKKVNAAAEKFKIQIKKRKRVHAA